jgi:hypothetical protein
LGREHLNAFIGSLNDIAAKTRNHYRESVRGFLRWAVRKDYLPLTHRLEEADGMRQEHDYNGKICFYTPNEFAALLKSADDTLRPMVAIGGLAGLCAQRRQARLICLREPRARRVRLELHWRILSRYFAEKHTQQADLTASPSPCRVELFSCFIFRV